MLVPRIRDRHTRALDDDSGFTLVELIVAMVIITTVLMVLMAVQTSALVTTLHAKQRQQGTAVANEVMEELRALPWATIQRGVHPAHATSTPGGDPNDVGGILRPVHDASISETLVMTSPAIQATDVPPLSGAGGTNRVVRTDPAIPGVTFAARSYVSLTPSLASGVLTLTVIVTWKQPGTNLEKWVIARSAAYNPASGGCGNTATQPFLGACQAMLDSDASAADVAMTVSAFDPTNPSVPLPLLPGGSVQIGIMNSAETSASLSSNQAATTSAGITTAGSAETSTTGVETKSGHVRFANIASSDVGASGAAPANPADVSATGGTASRTFVSSPAGTTMTLNPPTSLTGYARAKAGGLCQTGVPLGQPCSVGSISTEGNGTAQLALPGATVTIFGTTGAVTRNAWTSRFATLPSTAPALGCDTITGAGCVSSGASRAIASMELGTTSWSGGNPGYLVRLTGYTDAVKVEHGVGKLAVAPTGSRGGTLTYWNGSSMATLGIGPSVNTTVSLGSATRSITGGTLTAQGSITVRPFAVVRTGTDPLCKVDGCTVTEEMSSITAAITYTTVIGSVTRTVMVGVDLGAIRASARYKAAPDA